VGYDATMPKSPELKLTGKGVAPIRIKELDRLAEAYVTERDKRMELTPKEVAAKTKLIDALHDHADKIRLPDGSLVYSYDETIIRLTPGKEKLKVEAVRDVDEAEPE
jgi:hypothetical protein